MMFDEFFTALGCIVLLFAIFMVGLLIRDAIVATYNYFKGKREKKVERLYEGKYNRDTTWGTLDGREIPIRCLEDMHLANIIAWVSDRPHNYRHTLLDVLKKETKLRKLSKEFLDGAPYPFKDQDGIWRKGIALIKGTYQYRRIGR